MTENEFYNNVTHDEGDIVRLLLALLAETDAEYCVIGGLAVNAYAEPVVSLDLGAVVAADRLESLRAAAQARDMVVEEFEHSVNLSGSGSDVRIQLQRDARYQEFIPRAASKEVLGYTMNVAALEDVLQGKVWAYSDTQRRASKRQKDLADIMRLVEEHPELKGRLPEAIAARME